MDDSHRVKIQNSNILNALIEHVDGRRDMSSTQVTAGVALLKKVLPDLSAITLEGGDPDKPIKTEDASLSKLTDFLNGIASRNAG